MGIEQISHLIDKADEYISHFEEMTQRKNKESEIFWELDKLEMAVQALNYEKTTGIKLDEFFVSIVLQLIHPFLRSIFAHIFAQRPKRKKITG